MRWAIKHMAPSQVGALYAAACSSTDTYLPCFSRWTWVHV